MYDDPTHPTTSKLPYLLGGLAVVGVGVGAAWYLSHDKKKAPATAQQPPAKPAQPPSPDLWKPSAPPPGMPGMASLPSLPAGMPQGLPPIPQGFGAPPSLTPGTSEKVPGIQPGGGLPPSPYQVPPTASADLLAMAQNIAKNIKTTGTTGNRWSGPGGDHLGNHRALR